MLHVLRIFTAAQIDSSMSIEARSVHSERRPYIPWAYMK